MRVTTIDGEPRAWRTLSANLSRNGLFVRMPHPLEPGTRVAISLEARGHALPLAQGEVRWCRYNPSEFDGRFQGCGVRFTEYLHPRANELVDYLVESLDTGKPLKVAPRRRRRWPIVAVLGAAAASFAAVLVFLLTPSGQPPLPAPTGSPGALAGLAVVPNAADELAAMVSPAVDEAPAVANEENAPLDPALSAAVPPTDREQPVAAAAAQVAEPASAAAAQTAPGAPPVPALERELAPPAVVVRASEQVEVPVGPPAREVAAAVAARSPERVEVPAGLPAREVAGPTVAARSAERVEVPAPPAPEVAPAAVAKVVPPSVVPAPASASLRGAGAHSADGQLRLPSGAATALTWSASPEGLDVRPALRADSRVARVFALSDPPRLVFDIDGSVPSKSHAMAASSTLITRVRLGKQGTRTRVVLDLASEPHRVTAASDHALVQF